MDKRYRYPDIGDLIARKARGRVERARLSFGEKLGLLDKLRDDVMPIVRTRQARVQVRQKNAKRAIGTVD
jgi:hypothetical protein